MPRFACLCKFTVPAEIEVTDKRTGSDPFIVDNSDHDWDVLTVRAAR